MSLSAGFLWRFLDDAWDLLPSDDRALFEAYWSSFVRIAGGLQTRVYEAALSTAVADVPVFLTERWNRYAMDSASCDLFAKVEQLVLNGVSPVRLAVETAFYHTLTVSGGTGPIAASEKIIFADDLPRNLLYGQVIRGTVSVTVDGAQMAEGVDYVVNYDLGSIQPLPDGRLPVHIATTITYHHQAWQEGSDYIVDHLHATVERTPASGIPDGASVSVSYTYNGTATTPFQSIAGVIPSGRGSLVDASANFASLLPRRTLTILEGPNRGDYSIEEAVSATEVVIAGLFPVAQADGGVRYSINAFPHAQRVPKNIASIPTLQDRIEAPQVVLEEGIDYVVQGGILSSREPFPMLAIGPTEDRGPIMWAEKTLVDRETPYRNFGVLINFYRSNSEAYRQALQGLWYAFWTGSTPQNLQRGLHILLGLPYARSAGTVVALTAPATAATGSCQVQDARGRVTTYTLPAGLDAAVAVGSVVERFAALSTGVRVIDRTSEPGFVASRLGRSGIERFLTARASRGVGDTDETRALLLLEHHLFLPQILAEAVTSRINVTELVTFLDNMKPQWTAYILSFNADVNESLGMDNVHEQIEVDYAIDLSATVTYNDENRAWNKGRLPFHRSSGEMVYGGSQATGNFRDLGADFAADGCVNSGDVLRIQSDHFKGYHQVLARISSTVLSLDIPDAELILTPEVEYFILPREWALGDDAVGLKREHIVRDGANYLVPTVLSVKTDADLTGIDDDMLLAMLLVDEVALETHEISLARADLSEFSIGTIVDIHGDTVPRTVTPGANAHQVASAAIVRRDNTAGHNTHAFAI